MALGKAVSKLSVYFLVLQLLEDAEWLGGVVVSRNIIWLHKLTKLSQFLQRLSGLEMCMGFNFHHQLLAA
jgi:hypothetical protein